MKPNDKACFLRVRAALCAQRARLTSVERRRQPKEKPAGGGGEGDRDDARDVGGRAEAAGALRCAPEVPVSTGRATRSGGSEV